MTTLPCHLLDAKAAARMLGLKGKGGRLNDAAARSLLMAWGVPFVDLGPGRGRGMRWRAEDVADAVSRRLVGRSAPVVRQSQSRKRKPAEPSLFDLSAKEALARLSGK